MRGWAIVVVWTHEFMIQHVGMLKQLQGFYDREHCDQIVGRLNREQVLGGYAKGLTGSYYVALPYPVVQETPVCLDDVERL